MRRPALSALALSIGCIVATPVLAADSSPGEAAWAQPKAAADLQLRDPDYPAAWVSSAQLPALSDQRVSALKQFNASRERKPLQIGVERDLGLELGSAFTPALSWKDSPQGGRSARIAIASADAAALRLGLVLRNLPDAAELRFFSAGSTASEVDPVSGAEINAQLRSNGVYWTPVTEGSAQELEIHLPDAVDERWIEASVGKLSHLLVSPSRSFDRTKIGESDFCEIDTICVSNPSAAYSNAKNSVARMVFQEGGSSFLCTGTLMNDTDSSTQVPYFYTAAHCFSNQTVANTLTTFWFYEATTCGGSTLSSNSRQVTGGAQQLYVSEASDVSFLRLNGTPPSGSYYLGWTSAQITAGTAITVIHHPSGDVKKVSLGQVKGLGPSSLASGSFIQAGYTSGTTEGGSSGSALLTLGSEYQLRGGLLGGSAGCSNSGNINTAANSDDFSRFDLAYSNISQYLNPSSTPPPSNIDYTGAWSNPSQDGWGLVVIRGATSGAYGMYIYHYDNASTPSWYLASGALSGTSFNQPLFTFTGPWFGISPFNPGQVSARQSGTLTVNFSTASTATISFTIDGRTVSTSLNKLNF